MFVLATALRRSPAPSNAISSLAPFLRGFSSRSGVMTVLHVIRQDQSDGGENLAGEWVHLVLLLLENPLLPPFPLQRRSHSWSVNSVWCNDGKVRILIRLLWCSFHLFVLLLFHCNRDDYSWHGSWDCYSYVHHRHSSYYYDINLSILASHYRYYHCDNYMNIFIIIISWDNDYDYLHHHYR